ncbi:MAG TPA: hypothetical protein VFQ68_45745 [Streptosporangiaceae bacterium]|nr:hypothetical protein [Streptosporangiaceae bacterium]
MNESTDTARDARGAAFEETVSAAGKVLEAELAAAGTDKAARRAAWARYGDVQDAAGAAYRAAQAEAQTETRNAHTCGRHCGTAYHPDALTVRLIEQYEADHR